MGRPVGVLALVLAVMLAAACQTKPDQVALPPVFTVHPWWKEPGTLVVFMPKQVARSKQTASDPLYRAWGEALITWMENTRLVKNLIDEGHPLRRNVKISSKTIPSGDYSLLLIGTEGRGVHLSEPLTNPALYLQAEAYALGEIDAAGLPVGAEPLRIESYEIKEDEEGDIPLPSLPGNAG